jgi:hypothetical protein
MRAVDAGSVVVAAAGNDFPFGNPEIYPADYPHVVTVGATGKNDLPAGFSSASPAVDLAAPGVNIPVAHPSDEILFSLFTGTSFAAPTVSAAAAWIWTVRPDLDRTQVGEILRQSADDVAKKGFDNRTGFGLLDIPAALGEPAPAPDPLEPNDDVDLVSARGIFGVAKPALTIPGNGWSRLRARIDAAEDPGDVYRVVVPARTTLGVRLTSKQDVGVTLWRPETKTVHAREGTAKLYRLDSSDAPKAAAERVEWRNGKAKPVTVYLEVWLPGRAGASTRADYTLRLTRS